MNNFSKKFLIFLLFQLLLSQLAFGNAEPNVSLQEANETLNYVFKIIPTNVTKALNGKIIIRVLDFNSEKLDRKTMSSAQMVHSLISSEKWNDKWILSINSKAKAIANCDKNGCDLDLLHLMLHQIAHIYDDMNILNPINKYETDAIKYCDAVVSFSKGQVPPQCQILNRYRKSISDHKDFIERVYSESEPAEAFPSKFVNYVLNPEFSCRNPDLANYFERRIGLSLQSNSRQCKTDFHIPHIESDFSDNEPLNLNPDRVFRIDYFLAGNGEGLESSQGHTMFRFVMCAPERLEVSEKCLQDTEYHITAGFAAFQGNESEASGFSGKIKGLTGGYPSILTFQRLYETTEQYNQSEDRSLIAYPLRLSKSEIRNFVLQTIETYWNHNRNYYFLNNNCATEGFALIKRSLNRPYNSIFNSGVKILSPKGLLHNLEDANLIGYETANSEPLEKYPKRIYEPNINKARYLNYFPSFAEIVAEGLAEDEKIFWRYKSAELRKAFDRLATTTEKSYEYARRFRLIEKTRLKRLNQAMGVWMQQQIAMATDAQLRESGINIENKYLDLFKRMRLRQSLNNGGNENPGIPINNELQVPLQELNSAQAELEKIFSDLKDKTAKDFNAKFSGREEIKLSVHNMNFYNKIVSDYSNRK
ncbi:MAG: lipoprotein N-acyltransferase Lnb domain-containing protein [Bdellovibrio sp.]